jgi:hypothetical protein
VWLVFYALSYYSWKKRKKSGIFLNILLREKVTNERANNESFLKLSSDHAAFILFLETSAGIFKQSMGARNQVGIGLSYRPSRLHSLAELVPWNRFLGSLKV